MAASLLAIPLSAMAESDGVAQVDMKAVHVVCVGETREVLLEENEALAALYEDLKKPEGGVNGKIKQIVKNELEKILKDKIPQVGDWYYLPIGSGFVVDAAKKYVVTNDHVARACSFIEGKGRRIAILEKWEKGGLDVNLAVRKVRNASKNISLMPKPVCSKSVPCNFDGLEEFSAPDLAILELSRATMVEPVLFDKTMKVTNSDNISVHGFPGITQVVNDARSGVVVQPTVINGNFSKIIPVKNESLKKLDHVETNLYELHADLNPGNSGGPVMFGDKLFGVAVLSRTTKGISSGIGYAVPASEVTNLLSKAGINYIQSSTAPTTITTPPIKIHSPEGSFLDSKTILFIVLGILFVGLLIVFIILGKKSTGSSTEKDKSVNNKAGTTPTVSIATTEKTEAKFKLVCVSGSHEGKSFNFPSDKGKTDTITFGRDAGVCQLVFGTKSPTVSKLHCRVVWSEAGQFISIEDLNSSNGTYVDNQKIIPGQPHRLSKRNKISLGGKDTPDVFRVE